MFAQMLMHAVAHVGVQTLQESALKVDPGRKIPCHTGESNLCQRRADLTFYKLSYILTLQMLIYTQYHNYP